MGFSFTGITFLLAFFAIALLTYRFFQYWRYEKSTISKLFFCITVIFTLFVLISAIVGLFFANNIYILKGTVIFSSFLQSIALAIVGYMLVYIKFPRFSPWLGFIVIFLLGLVATILTAITPFNPYLEASGGINWGFQPFPDAIKFFLFLAVFFPLFIINIQQIKISKLPLLRTKTFGLILILIFTILACIFDFFLESILNLGAVSSDMAIGVLSIIVLIVVFFTQKSPQSEKKYISSSHSTKIL